jgi:hypothetical protein
MLPRARKHQLLVQEVGDELVVYDQERHQVHRLNRTAALVWRHCDGQTTVAELAALLATESNLPADEELAWLALRQLEKADLLQQPPTRPAGGTRVTRRQLLAKLGRTAAVALLVPVVMTIVAPTPAMAQTTVGGQTPIPQQTCQGRNPTAGCGGAPCQDVGGICGSIPDPNIPNMNTCDCINRPTGSPCSGNAYCASGTCNNGTCT